MTTLLNDDGSASMATALMMSHHGFRRDLGRFAEALRDPVRPEALRDEWQRFRATLHGHHQAEDAGIFPQIRTDHRALVSIVDSLEADHRRIDPLLEQGDQAFAEVPGAAAAAVIAELAALLDPHLATEEVHVIPHLRAFNAFPPPANDAEAAMYAEGFAWAMHGIHPDVIEQVTAMLPESLRARLPAARAAFDERCVRVWGTAAAGASRSSIP